MTFCAAGSSCAATRRGKEIVCAESCVNGWPLVQLQMKAGSRRSGPLAPRARGPDLDAPPSQEIGVAPIPTRNCFVSEQAKKPRRLGRGLVWEDLVVETHEPALPTLHQDLTSKFPITKRCNGAWLGDWYVRVATGTVGRASSRWHSIRRFLALSRHRLAHCKCRYWGQSGHDLLRCTCLLLTQSGHQVPVLREFPRN